MSGNWQKRFDDADLTRRILDRTSGRACTRAEDLLGASWDAEPEAVDGELLAGHLDGCAGCRELATILDRLQPALPGLAEREPGPAFTARVLARTSRRQPVPGHSLAGRLQRKLQGMWNRPRFALEAAWTAAALAALLVWSPLAPAAAPDRVGAVVQAGTGAAPELVARIEDLGHSALLTGRKVLGPRAVEMEEQLGELRTELAHHVEIVKQAGLTLWLRLTGDDSQRWAE